MKRGSSGLSLVVAVNKPAGLSSHDVVNRCRRIFGERRVGHTGTLDPLATGVLPICVGPATRLDRYMTGHDKRYRVTMRFGYETTTDDCQGEPTVRGEILSDLIDGAFASTYVKGIIGPHMQVPPAYSAIKIDGRKAYEQARKGQEVALEPRPIEVYEAALVSRNQDVKGITWTIDFSVSKGTYIRALVRDIGRELGCPAHVEALQRLQAGRLQLEDCVSLESLESLKTEAALDPVRLLGFRFVFADGNKRVESGNYLPADDAALHVFGPFDGEVTHCACTSNIQESADGLRDNEHISIIVENRLKAIYRFDAQKGVLKSDCVFSTPIIRG